MEKSFQQCASSLEMRSFNFWLGDHSGTHLYFISLIPELFRMKSARVKAVRRRAWEFPEKSLLCLGWAIGSAAKSYLTKSKVLRC
jgi:hypothetical protein